MEIYKILSSILIVVLVSNVCNAACPGLCNLPMDKGSCKGAMPSFHWDNKAKTCQKFLYGGCKGNGNRFDAKPACEAKCGVCK